MMNCCYLWAYNYSNGMASDRNFSFTTLNLPPAQLRMRRDASGRVRVYDRWRSRWVVLTPEEWVRQQFVSMLVTTRGYVSGRIANEVSLEHNGTPRRCDTVVYRYDGKPLMIVEYKAPEVVITQAVFDQIARYGMVLRAEYLTVSNGLQHFCCKIDYAAGTYCFLADIPDYSSIV